MGFRLGIDSGGTFTDVVLFDERTGGLALTKVPSTPADASIGVYNGVRKILEREGVDASDVSALVHGTTVATNALLEYKGVETALLLTRGFKDVLTIVRQDRPKLYDYFERRPEPLVPRHMRFEVTERILHNGDVLEELDEAEVVEVVDRLKSRGVTAVAVCLLHSYANPGHELRIGERFREHFPAATVSLSCEVLPEMREYERMSTTVVNAYVMPIVDRYLGKLASRLAEGGIRAAVNVMQSSGGIMPAASAGRKSVATILSGPAGGVLGSRGIARLAGFRDVITLDIGGTSCDICLIDDGDFLTTKESEIGGHAIKIPMIDINTIGAGGGSTAWIDSGGLLRVGPQSAGSDPGPACYGTGGTGPTVTDANLVLGRINPASYVGGEMELYVDRAEVAIRRTVAEPLGLDVPRAAEGIISVVNANMARGIRRVSVERGHDLRDFALFSFGGGGPLHSAELASELNTPRMIVPISPGVNSAIGLLTADFRYDYSRTLLATISGIDPGKLNGVYQGLEREGHGRLAEEAVAESDMVLLRSADVRYRGQGYELEVPVPAGEITPDGLLSVRRDFDAHHDKLYGYSHPDAETEVVHLRLAALGRVRRPDFQKEPPGNEDARAALVQTRDVFLDGDFVATGIYDRARLRPNNGIVGPAIVEQFDSTTLIKPGQSARVDEYSNLIVDVRGH